MCKLSLGWKKQKPAVWIWKQHYLATITYRVIVPWRLFSSHVLWSNWKAAYKYRLVLRKNLCWKKNKSQIDFRTHIFCWKINHLSWKCNLKKWITFHKWTWYYEPQLLCWHIFYDALTRIIEYASRAIALHNAMFTDKTLFICYICIFWLFIRELYVR